MLTVAAALWLPTTEYGPSGRPGLAFFGAWLGGFVPLPLVGPALVWLAARRRHDFARQEALDALRFHGERSVAIGLLTLLAPLGIVAGMLSFGVGLLLYLVAGILATWVAAVGSLALGVRAIRRARQGRAADTPSLLRSLRRRPGSGPSGDRASTPGDR